MLLFYSFLFFLVHVLDLLLFYSFYYQAQQIIFFNPPVFPIVLSWIFITAPSYCIAFKFYQPSFLVSSAWQKEVCFFSILHKYMKEKGGGWSKKGGVLVEGCWDGFIFKALSFHLFSFLVSWVFRVSKNGMWGKEKRKRKYMYAPLHVLRNGPDGPNS